MAKKTFKLGEVCKGGVITVETSGNTLKIIAKEWDYSKGSNKGSDQSQAKEWDRREFTIGKENVYLDASFYLQDLTTSYWSDEILKWVGTKCDLEKQFFFVQRK